MQGYYVIMLYQDHNNIILVPSSGIMLCAQHCNQDHLLISKQSKKAGCNFAVILRIQEESARQTTILRDMFGAQYPCGYITFTIKNMSVRRTFKLDALKTS